MSMKPLIACGAIAGGGLLAITPVGLPIAGVLVIATVVVLAFNNGSHDGD